MWLCQLTTLFTRAHLSVLNRLIELAPALVQTMVKDRDYQAFRYAARKGNLPVLQRLVELEPNHLQLVMEDNDLREFLLNAGDNGQLPVLNYLMTFYSVFCYAEIHQREYGEQYVRPFVQSTLARLRDEKMIFDQANLNGVFDIAIPDQAKLLFYMIRQLIRRNDAELLDDLRFLLSIPAVKNLAHMEVTPHNANELLRLALTVGNQAAADISLNIPAVRTLAEQQGQFDLSALARDRESSMRALSTDEQRRLKKATDRYLPMLHCHKNISSLVR